MTPRKKRTRRNSSSENPGIGTKWALLMLLPALALLVFFGILETGLRLWDSGVPDMSVPSGIKHPPYYNNPGQVLQAKVFGMHHRYTINSRGMRGPERPLKKTAGVRRILFLGDSLVFGAMVDDSETLPVRLEHALNSEPGAARWEVLNAGVGSYNIWDYAGYLKERGLAFKPDIVVIGLYLNDHQRKGAVVKPSRPAAPAPRLSLSRRLWQEFLDLRIIRGLNQWMQRHQDPKRPFFAFRKSETPETMRALREAFGGDEASFSALRSYLRDYRYRPGIFLPVVRSLFDLKKWRATRNPLARIRDLCRRRGIRLMTVVFPVQFEFVPGYAHTEPFSTIRSLHRELGIPVYDAKIPLDADGDAESLYRFRYDYTHFNAEGYSRVARAMTGWLDRLGWLKR